MLCPIYLLKTILNYHPYYLQKIFDVTEATFLINL